LHGCPPFEEQTLLLDAEIAPVFSECLDDSQALAGSDPSLGFGASTGCALFDELSTARDDGERVPIGFCDASKLTRVVGDERAHARGERALLTKPTLVGLE
jgi:hypothetical protein